MAKTKKKSDQNESNNNASDMEIDQEQETTFKSPLGVVIDDYSSNDKNNENKTKEKTKSKTKSSNEDQSTTTTNNNNNNINNKPISTNAKKTPPVIKTYQKRSFVTAGINPLISFESPKSTSDKDKQMSDVFATPLHRSTMTDKSPKPPKESPAAKVSPKKRLFEEATATDTDQDENNIVNNNNNDENENENDDFALSTDQIAQNVKSRAAKKSKTEEPLDPVAKYFAEIDKVQLTSPNGKSKKKQTSPAKKNSTTNLENISNTNKNNVNKQQLKSPLSNRTNKLK